MHKTIYQAQQEPLVDINLTKALTIVCMVLAFFVLPAVSITYIQNNSQRFVNASQASNNQPASQESKANINQPRVAGVSDERQAFDISNRSTQFAIVGIFFLGLSAMTLGYLIFGQKEPGYTKSDIY